MMNINPIISFPAYIKPSPIRDSIINPTTKLSVDVKGAKTDNSTHTQVYPAHDRCNQDWLFEEDEEGYYVIISRCSGKVLDASLYLQGMMGTTKSGN